MFYRCGTPGGGGGGTPTNITPSNTTPAALTANTPVNPTASGYAISSYNTANIGTGDIVSVSGRTSIYQITKEESTTPVSIVGSLVSSLTPSDSSPASVSSGGIIKASASGYLYSTIQKFKQGSVTLSTSSQTSVNLGFKPKYLCVYSTKSYYSNIYDENVSTTQFIRATTTGPLLKAFDSNYNGGLVSINSNGFTCRTCTTSVGLTWKYIAIG